MSDGEINEIMRVLGRIEGNVEELRRRADVSDAKLGNVADTVNGLTLDRARVRGGYAVIAAIAGIAATLGGILAKFLHI